MFRGKTIGLMLTVVCIVRLAWGNPQSGVLIGDPLVEKPELTIQKSDVKNIVVDYTFPGVTVRGVKKGETTFDLITMEGFGSSGTVGAPELPVVTKLFAIPDRARVIIKSFTPTYKTYQGIYPYPHQDLEYDNPHNTTEWVWDDRYYRQGEIFPERWVTLGEAAIMRDFRVIPVNICPVRVNAVTGEVLILTNLHLELEFVNGETENIKTHHFSKTVESFNKMYPDLIANYDWINPNGVEVKGSLLIVYPEVNNVLNVLQPLIDWKKRRGYATTAVSVTNNVSTATVQSVIQNAYNTYDPPLEAVILIGDAGGSIDINCYTYSGGSSDHQYTQLEGGDILADIIIGRYSVDGLTTLQTAVNKVLYYESNPTLTNTAWYRKGAVCAGSSSSGLSTIQISRSFRDWWIKDGFTQVDTLWYTMGGSIPTFMSNECNSGITALNYRGYIGVNGFTTSSVYALNNPYKLPYAVIITCGTGDFGGPDADLSEAWLRAGSPTNPIGGIGGIGTATAATHTRHNNTVNLGLWFGLHQLELYQLGQMLFRGKYELFLAYQYDSGQMTNFTMWNNLMGDPTTDMWTAIPQVMTVNYNDTIPVGATNLTITVTNSSGNPLAGRYVTYWKGSETYVGGLTDENGIFSAPINVPTSGNLYVTVTNHNDYPHLGTVAVVSSPVNPSLMAVSVDDDSTAPSAGNDDGYANPGEVLELDLQLKNYGTSVTATGISATLSSADTNVNITTATNTYASLAPFATAYGDGRFVAQLGSYFNQGYQIPFTLTVNSEQGTFISAFNLMVRSGESIIQNTNFVNGILEPGETDNLVVSIRNSGQMNLTGVTATITSDDDHITIIDDQGTFGQVNAGQIASNASNTFTIQADAYATYGHHATIIMHLASANGFEQDLEFYITIGQMSTDDPMGPDAYGYYCVDNSDVDYSGHPTYNWVDINTIGTNVGLSDYGNSQDVSSRFNLPFEFTFYGQGFNILTVCSNGWLAFGDETYHADFRNSPIPSAGGAVGGMLCPLWDDLVMGSGNVYYWNDAVNHRFIVEYYNVSYMSGGGTLKFEIILYDPAFYPTPTGDGEIVFQYSAFNANSGSGYDVPYWTTGIENHEHTGGIQYAYWNTYSPGAATISSGRAIKFTTIEPLRGPVAPTIEVTLEPVNPPIVIPATGGTFQYTLSATNTGTQTTVFDLWIMAQSATGTNYGPLLNAQNIEFTAGQTATKTKTQTVPGSIPAGTYTYSAYVGDYPTNTVWDSAGFTFSKTGIRDQGLGISPIEEWSIAVWDDSQQLTANNQQPMEYMLGSAYPNPFNPSTEISYALPEAGKVTLAVFNTLGRQIATLENGYKPAGYYSVKFDGSQLSSGIYYYTLKSGEFSQTKKMLLVK